MKLNVLRGAALAAALCLGVVAQVVSAQAMGMDAMLKQTGYGYTTHNATTWSIDLNRKNLGKVKVILSTGSDILVTFVIVAKKAAIQKTPQMMEALLTANHDYDYTKIGLDKDGDMFVRVDMPLRTVDPTELKSIIDQVANASDEVYAKVGRWVGQRSSSAGQRNSPSPSNAPSQSQPR
jgi:putative sensory transduction regulator